MDGANAVDPSSRASRKLEHGRADWQHNNGVTWLEQYFGAMETFSAVMICSVWELVEFVRPVHQTLGNGRAT